MIPKAISRHKDAKRTTAGDVARVVRYVCGKAVAVELCNLSGDWQDAPMQMWAVADGSSRATSLMYHMMLSWPETECPTDAQAIEAARTAIAELGVQDHQAVIAVHRDRTCVHVHVVINRINALTFGAMSTSNDFTKLERACRQIEATQGWSADRGRFDAVVTETPDGPKVTLEPKPQAHWEAKQERRAAERGPSASDIHAERKTGVVSLAEALSDPWKGRIRAAMDEAPDWAGVHEALSEIGLRYVKSGSGARILLVGSDAYMKPSQLGKPYAMEPMQKRFGPLVTPESLDNDAATHKAMMSGGNDVEELQQHSQQLEPVLPNALIRDDADIAPLTKSETFKLTLLQRSYVGVTLDPDVVRAIHRVTLDASPPTVTLRDGGSVVDKGTVILGSPDGDDAVKAKLMIALAAAKGWDRCKITGSEAFCQIAVQLAREAGLVVTNAPDAPVDVGEGMPRADARSRLPVIPDTPWQVEVNIDDLRQSARGAAAQFKRRKQALANAQREEAGRLRALLGRSRTPFAQALRQGLQLHHDDERRTLEEQRAVTPEIPIPPLSGLHRRVRAARRWLQDKTSLMSVAHPSQSVLPDHTACRQMWLAIALQEQGATGHGDDDSMAELPDKHLRNTRLTATGEVLFAHRDSADNVVGFEVAFESSEADAGTGFAAGGQRTAWILGDAATAQRAVVTNYASEALQMAQDEDRDDTLYISVGGAIGAHAREILAGLLSDKIVLACSVNDTSNEALLREVQRIAPQAEWMAAASGVAPSRLPETGELPDEEPADYGPDTDHGM